MLFRSTYGVPTAAIATTGLTTAVYNLDNHTDGTVDEDDNLTPYNVDEKVTKKPIKDRPSEPKNI